MGVPLRNVLRAACVNAVEHYGLPVGLLRVGDPADFVVSDSVTDFGAGHILATYINGVCVAEEGVSKVPRVAAEAVNQFAAAPVGAADLATPAGGALMRVIAVDDGQLITRTVTETPYRMDGHVVADPARDVLKIAVLARYPGGSRKPAVAYVRGFGLRCGAIASSVAHDSHNIVAVGASDQELARAINLVIAQRGGLAAVCGEREEVLPLPVGGIMTTEPGESVAAAYGSLQGMAKGEMGSKLRAPFMTLSFMALLVIPALKLSDRGLFDGERFGFTPLFLPG